MNSKEKMQELIKQKQNGGGKAKKMAEPKNDRKNMRKGPKIFNQANYNNKQLFLNGCLFFYKKIYKEQVN